MAWPPTIRVKLSSEAAGAISVTPVVVQELTPRELIEQMLATTGKDAARIREILRRGALVSGASRFRWAGWDADLEGLREVLSGFPDSNPSLAFSRERCRRAVLYGGAFPLELPRETLSRRRWLQRRSFWDSLMETAGAGEVRYQGYSYRDRADRYLRRFTGEEAERLRQASVQIAQRVIRGRVRRGAFSEAEFYVQRES